jgi:citrate lyase subunit beta-like protein
MLTVLAECIHPDQAPLAQRAFSPEQHQVEWAARIVIANEKAVAAGRGAWTLDGKMIDAPVIGLAQTVLDKARHCGIDVDAIQENLKDQEPE